MRKLFIALALLSTASIAAAVSTASASTTGFDAAHRIGWQHAFDLADCSGGGCNYEEPQDPLASPEDGKRSSSPDAVQDCQGQCAKPAARSLNVADCASGGCKYEEPQDPLASPEDGKRGSSPDAVQDCSNGGCAKPEARSVNIACSGDNCKYDEPQDPLASPEDGKRSSSPNAVQTQPMLSDDGCGDGTCKF